MSDFRPAPVGERTTRHRGGVIVGIRRLKKQWLEFQLVRTNGRFEPLNLKFETLPVLFVLFVGPLSLQKNGYLFGGERTGLWRKGRQKMNREKHCFDDGIACVNKEVSVENPECTGGVAPDGTRSVE
eukprot:GHVO01009568.1.p1 GENE.GHVO01009568.1~~GHVO01009568.1.p1  ORF type:complete len:127 (+),score=10.35 GHVO01009568.1:327-707(+)